MQITLKEFREIVRSVLSEATCSACGNKQAYIGLNDVECPNPQCKNFSEKQAEEFPSLKRRNHPNHPAFGQKSWNSGAKGLMTIKEFRVGDWLEFDGDIMRISKIDLSPTNDAFEVTFDKTRRTMNAIETDLPPKTIVGLYGIDEAWFNPV